VAPHGPANDVDHAEIALERGHGRRVGRPGPSPAHRHQALDRGLPHRHLAQRREDLRDVAQKHRVGPDDEDALLVAQPAVLVEEEGGAVQADRRPPRSRAALDDHACLDGRPDDLVLLGLDGGDDVAHLAAALPLGRDIGVRHDALHRRGERGIGSIGPAAGRYAMISGRWTRRP